MTMTTARAPTKPVQGNGLATMTIIAALLSATGRPFHKTVTLLGHWGVSPDIAGWILHIAPVLLILAAITAGRALGRGRSQGVRWMILGGFSAVAGALLAFCLDLFAGVPDIAARFVGPLSEASRLDELLWLLGGLGLAYGLLYGAIGVFGRPAITALQVEPADPECVDIRRAERSMFVWTAWASITLGIACIALAISRQAAPDARLAPAIVSVLALVLSTAANYRLWASFDEFQRQQVIVGYAISAIALTFGAFVWALAETLGIAPALDAAGVFLMLILVQTIAVVYVGAMAMGKFSAAEKAA
jgi:hypothetical protein